MDADFWRERWNQGQIGFHQSEVNSLLTRHWQSLELDATARVFVPMCGKTLDMQWLRERGHPVTGVEFSDVAIRDFFAAAELEPTHRRDDVFEISEANGISLLCGDFFSLTSDHLAGVRAVYDRAAFVALPPDLRQRYADHIAAVLPHTVSILMIAFDYDARDFTGPPFSVPPDEIATAYPAFRVETLERSGPHPAPPHLAERGLVEFNDTVVRLTR